MASIPSTSPQLRRKIGPFQATTLNMSQMVGIGPFITIPAMIVAFGGPQAVIGWIAGAVLALADGLIWAELGASMPGSGGTYLYLREAFKHRTGHLMPFLFVWSAVLFIPLVMSTGVIGFVQYLGYLAPGMSDLTGTLVGLGLIAVIIAVLWRRIESLGKLTVVLWAIMIATGAIWANQAWGSYWSWDPIETWSLIVWLIYAVYLHLRFTLKWGGERLAWFAIIAMPMALFALIGIPAAFHTTHAGIGGLGQDR